MPENTPATPSLPRRVVFRSPGVAYLGVVFVVICASPLAAAAPWLTLLYVVPAVILYWLIRTRTVVDAERLVVRRMFSTTALRWSDVTSLRMADRAWLHAVRADGSEVALATVRARHIPVLALISGGRITDPTAPTAEQPDTVAEPDTEVEPADPEIGADNAENVAGADQSDALNS